MSIQRQRGQLGLVIRTINEGRMPPRVTSVDIAALTGLDHSQASNVLSNAAKRTEIFKREGRDAHGRIVYRVNPIAAQNYKGRPGSLDLSRRRTRNNTRNTVVESTSAAVKPSDLNPIDELLDAMAKAEPLLKRMAEAYEAVKKLEN